MFSCNGRPGTRQGGRSRTVVVRYCPSTRIPLPSHAAAAACLSTSGPPAFRHPPYRALSVFPDTTGIAPSPARHVAPRPGSRHAGSCPAGAGSLPRLGGPPGRRWYASVRALPRMWRTVPCDASSTAYAAALQRGTGAALVAAFTRRALRPAATDVYGAPYHRIITRAPKIFLARPLARWPEGRFCARHYHRIPYRAITGRDASAASCDRSGSDGALHPPNSA